MPAEVSAQARPRCARRRRSRARAADERPRQGKSRSRHPGALLSPDHRGVRLQLPLYAIAVAQCFGADEVSGAIKPLVFPEIKADKFAFELREKEAAVRATIELFANAIVDGRFPAFPADTDKDFNACKY